MPGSAEMTLGALRFRTALRRGLAGAGGSDDGGVTAVTSPGAWAAGGAGSGAATFLGERGARLAFFLAGAASLGSASVGAAAGGGIGGVGAVGATIGGADVTVVGTETAGAGELTAGGGGGGAAGTALS